MSNIDSIKEALDRAYAKYDRMMNDAPKYMTLLERNQRLARIHAQRGRIEGLELAMELISAEDA